MNLSSIKTTGNLISSHLFLPKGELRRTLRTPASLLIMPIPREKAQELANLHDSVMAVIKTVPTDKYTRGNIQIHSIINP